MKTLMRLFIQNLNSKMIHPEKDIDLLLKELEGFGVYFSGEEKGWVYKESEKTGEE